MRKPTMSKAEFAVMSALVASGNPILSNINGKAAVSTWRLDLKVAPGVFSGLLGKGWIALSPIHPDGHHATDAGRGATVPAAAAYLRAFVGEHGEAASFERVHDGGAMPQAQALERLGLLEIVVIGKARVVLTDAGRDLLDGKAPTYPRFEDNFRSLLDPEGFAREQEAEAARERAASDAARAEAEGRRRAALAAAEERRRRESLERERRAATAEAERRVLELAEAAFLQRASHDDLMAAVERMLAAREAAGPPEAVAPCPAGAICGR